MKWEEIPEIFIIQTKCQIGRCHFFLFKTYIATDVMICELTQWFHSLWRKYMCETSPCLTLFSLSVLVKRSLSNFFSLFFFSTLAPFEKYEFLCLGKSKTALIHPQVFGKHSPLPTHFPHTIFENNDTHDVNFEMLF